MLVIVGLADPSVARALGTPADYARAASLRQTYESLAVDIAGPANPYRCMVSDSNRRQLETAGRAGAGRRNRCQRRG
jgi:hypothetical protein